MKLFVKLLIARIIVLCFILAAGYLIALEIDFRFFVICCIVSIAVIWALATVIENS